MNTENIKNTALTPGMYVKPAIEVITVDNEGILASSAGEFGDGGGYDGWS